MSAKVLAETLGLEFSELKEYAYQRYERPKVYAIGEQYFAAHKSKPKHGVGGPWKLHSDQFFSGLAGTAVWVSEATGEQA